MAAGKVDVSRRGVFDLTRRISDCRSGRSYGVCLNGDIKSDGKVELKRDNAKKRESGYGDRDKKGVVGGFLDGRPSFDVEDGEIKVRSAEVVDVDHNDVLPPEKRRKLSPIIRDKDDKMSVGIHPKNGVVVSEHELDEFPVDMHYSFTQLAGCSDEPELGQLDEEDFSHAPKISTCRWVFDEEEEERLEKARTSSQSCLSEREGSDGAAGESSGSERRFGSSNGGECSMSDLVNNDFMEVDDTEDGRPIADPTYSDSEDDAADIQVCEPSSRHMLRECRSVYEYERLGKISEGSYGIVYRAKDKASGAIVALKKLKMGVDREGFPMHYLREINALMSFNHPAIVDVKEVVLDDSSDGLGNVYMVMEYMEHDLKALMGSRKQPFSQSEVKCLMLQLLEGVKYLHDNWVLHRDLKTSNLLLNNKGELKICDFGMARQYGSPLKPYTQLVVTLWYRAPELLLGSNQYSTSVDMWSVGCIMAELLANKPLFDGKNELEQINKIFRTLGTPNEKIWLGYSQLPGSKVNYAQQPYNKLRDKFPRTLFTGSPVLSDLGFDLLSKLLTYDPEKRITVDDALNHAWFREVPHPKSKHFMPTFPVGHARKRAWRCSYAFSKTEEWMTQKIVSL